jgi:CheY-like chemotaxis protein
VITDLSLKDSDGLELVKDITQRFPGLPVLALSMHDELVYAERAPRAGHEDLDVLGVVEAPDPTLPARVVLHFVEEEVAALADGLGEDFPVAPQHQIELRCLQRLEAVILEVQVDQTRTAGSLVWYGTGETLLGGHVGRRRCL